MNSLSDQQVIAERNNVEMIRRPYLWPHCVLPLKRISGGNLDVAIVYALDEDGIHVVEGMSMFGAVGDQMTKHVFKDATEIVDAGWVVD